MAAIANVFGRLEAFSISVLLYVLGYIQQATSNNVQAFASAQMFYAAGATGLRILQQIFVADTSDLLNRALFSSLPDAPFLFTTWAGPPMAESLRSHATWRWGYGIWAIILPVSFLPLALSLFFNAAKLRRLPRPPKQHRSLAQQAIYLWYELDIMGLLLLSAAISLLLIPLTLALSTAKGGFRNGSMIAMLVVGGVSAIAFALWESNAKLAPKPFIAGRILADRTVLAGCIIAFFYFGMLFSPALSNSMVLISHSPAVFYTSIYPYFSSYLQVVHSQSITAAGNITQTFSFTSTVSSIVVSLFIKYTRHYKYFVTAGACIYLLGIGIMIRYRAQGSSIAQIVGTQIAIGIGGGMVNVPAQLGVQASVTHDDVAAATVIFLTFLQIGGSVGSAISGVVWSRNIQRKLALYLPPEARGNAAEIYGNLASATSLYPVGTPERVAINRSYQETMNILLIIAACFCAPLFPLSLLMRNYRLDRIDQKVTGTVIGNSRYRGDDGVRPEREEGGEGDGVKVSTAKE